MRDMTATTTIRRILRGLRRVSRIRPDQLLMRAWPLWFWVSNRRARDLHRRLSPALSDVQRRIVRDLETRGIGMVHLDELFPEAHLFSALRGHADELMTGAAVRTRKKFLQNLWDAAPALDLDNPFLRLALDPRVLDTVNAYMGMCAKFHSFTLNVTTPVGEGASPVQSQRWHRDPDDKKMCKIFLYLTDVDEGAGPFTYVAGSQYGGKWRRFFPQLPPLETYPAHGAVERRIPAGDILPGTGRAGTIIFCDTSGLHRGGYATRKERVMFTAVFVSPARITPITYRYPDNFRPEKHDLNPAQRFALEN